MYVCMYVCMHACTYVCMYVCMYVCVCVCVYGWIDGWMDGWMDGCTKNSCQQKAPFIITSHSTRADTSREVHTVQSSVLQMWHRRTHSTSPLPCPTHSLMSSGSGGTTFPCLRSLEVLMRALSRCEDSCREGGERRHTPVHMGGGVRR